MTSLLVRGLDEGLVLALKQYFSFQPLPASA